MSKISRLRYILAFVLVGFLSACAREEAPPSEEAPPPTVSVATVQSEQVALTRRLPGRTRSFLVAEVRPQVSGVVQERLFTEGASVEKGDILYQLDDAIYEADVASARASAVRARATLQLAELNAERVLDLFEKNAVSQQERDNAVAEADQAEADLNLAEAKLRSAEVLLGYSSIKAPISGRIGRSAVTQGALVTQNQSEPLATVQQLDAIYVDVAHSAGEMLDLQKAIASGELEEADLHAKILLEDGSELEHKGKVAFSEVIVDPT